MTADISSIDGIINPSRFSTNRSPSQDFADELAKEASNAPSKTRTQAKTSDAHAQAEQGGKAASDTKTPGEVVAEQATSAGQPFSGGVVSGSNSMLSAEAAVLTTQLQLGTVVQPIGVTEALLGSRVFGMHLLAGGYLSELVLPEGETADVSLDAETAVQSSVVSPEERPLPADLLRSSRSSSLEDQSSIEALTTQIALVENEVSEATSETFSRTPVATAATSAPLAQWLERSLRFTKQADGSTAVWLRDYRAGADEGARLRDSLLQEANATGVVLGKIMLNGREVWTSRSDT